MKNCFLGNNFKSCLPTKTGIFFYLFGMGLQALKLLDTSLFLGYTMIAHSV